MHQPVTVSVDAARATARLSGPLVLGNSYAITFSGLPATDSDAAAPEVVVLGATPGVVAARSSTDGDETVLALDTQQLVEAFDLLPPPPPPPRRDLPPAGPRPVNGAARPHGAIRLHFYVLLDGATLAQGDLTLLWAPFQYDGSGSPVQMQGPPGTQGKQGLQGLPGRNGVYAHAPGCVGFDVDENGHLWARSEDADTLLHGGDPEKPHYIIDTATGSPTKGHLLLLYYRPGSDAPQAIDLGSVVGNKGDPGDKGDPLTFDDLTEEQKAELKGAPGDKGDPLTWDDLTPEQKAALRGPKGNPGKDGKDGMTAEEIVALVNETMGDPDDYPKAGSKTWVHSGGLQSYIEAIKAQLSSAIAAKASLVEGKIPAAQLPGFVDDVLEYASTDSFPETGESGKIYVAKDTNKTYRWGGSEYVEISESLALGETSSTAFPGDRGKAVEMAVAGKQDTISDLATIRAGATAGATAYQKPPSGIPAADLAPGAVPTVPTNVSAFANDAGYLTEHQSLANYVQKSQTAGLLKNDGTVDTNTYLTQHQDISGKLDAAARNLLPYAISVDDVILAPQIAVYRAALNSDGTFPTITDTGIPTEAAYYQFELELTVPSTVPATIYGPTMGGTAFDSTASYAVGNYVVYDNVEYACVAAHSGPWDASHFKQAWVFLDGHGLPDPADLSGGETICVSVRLDCTARTFLASVWRVA